MHIKLSEAARATGISARTLSDWIARGIIPAPKSGKGNHREFGIRDVDRIAVVHDLTKIGLPATEAARAASAFCDARSYKRPHAQLHADGAKTVLLVSKDGASVHAMRDRESFETAIGKLFADEHTLLLLNVSETLRRVDDVLLKGSTRTDRPAPYALYRNGRQLHV